MKKFFMTLVCITFFFVFSVFSQEKPKDEKGSVEEATKPSVEKPLQLVKPGVGEKKKKAVSPDDVDKGLVTPDEAGAEPPKLVIDELVYNAGDVVRGDVIKHEFILKNKGKGVLKVLRVQPTCGCTVTKFDSMINPNEEGKIYAEVKTEGFSGEISKTINVQTNDKELSVFALTIKANVKTILAVKPQEKLSLGLNYIGQQLEKEFEIISEDGQPFEVLQIKCPDEKLKYQLTLAPDKKSAKLKVIIPGDYPVGSINANFELITTHPKVPKLNISVFGTMKEPLSVYPSVVKYDGLSKEFIKSNPDSLDLNKVVTLRLETEPNLEIKSAKCSVPFINVKVEETQPKQAYSIKLTIDPEKAKEGPFDGALVVSTNVKQITVPVKGVIF